MRISRRRLDWQTYSSAKGNLMTELPNRAGATLGTTDPPRHDRLRALIQHAFMKRILRPWPMPIRDIARDHRRRVCGAARFELSRISPPSSRCGCYRRLGLPPGTSTACATRPCYGSVATR